MAARLYSESQVIVDSFVAHAVRHGWAQPAPIDAWWFTTLGLLSTARPGCQWRLLPHTFPGLANRPLLW